MPVIVAKKRAYPAALETVLRAEEAVNIHFEAGRALQSAGVVLTVRSEAFSSRDVCGHDGNLLREYHYVK